MTMQFKEMNVNNTPSSNDFEIIRNRIFDEIGVGNGASALFDAAVEPLLCAWMAARHAVHTFRAASEAKRVSPFVEENCDVPQ